MLFRIGKRLILIGFLSISLFVSIVVVPPIYRYFRAEKAWHHAQVRGGIIQEAKISRNLALKFFAADFFTRKDDYIKAGKLLQEKQKTPIKGKTKTGDELNRENLPFIKNRDELIDEAKKQADEVTSLIPAKYRLAMIDALEAAGENSGQLIEAVLALESDQRGALAFLISNMPESDLKSLSSDFLIRNVKYAFKVRQTLPYVGIVPEDIFLNYVLPYASAEERRDEWRPEFYDRFLDIATESSSVEETVIKFNREVFRVYRLNFGLRTDRGPTWSPYESIEKGFVSCREASVMLIDACRAVGIPARMIILPSWRNTNASHAWPEVYDNGRWRPMTAWDPSLLDEGWVLPLVAIVLQTPPPKPKHRVYAVCFEKTDLHILLGPDVSLIDVSEAYLAFDSNNK